MARYCVCRAYWIHPQQHWGVHVVTHHALRTLVKGQHIDKAPPPVTLPDTDPTPWGDRPEAEAGLPSYAALSARAMKAAVTMQAYAKVKDGEWRARKKEQSPNGVGNFASLSALRRTGIEIDARPAELFGQLQGHFDETTQIVDEMRIAKKVSMTDAPVTAANDPLAGMGMVCETQMGQKFVQLSGDVFTLASW